MGSVDRTFIYCGSDGAIMTYSHRHLYKDKKAIKVYSRSDACKLLDSEVITFLSLPSRVGMTTSVCVSIDDINPKYYFHCEENIKRQGYVWKLWGEPTQEACQKEWFVQKKIPLGNSAYKADDINVLKFIAETIS